MTPNFSLFHLPESSLGAKFQVYGKRENANFHVETVSGNWQTRKMAAKSWSRGPLCLHIHYLHKSHNIPLLPAKNLHRHCFRLLLGHFHVPGEIAHNGHAKVLGGNRGVLWDCASSELKLPIAGAGIKYTCTELYLTNFLLIPS